MSRQSKLAERIRYYAYKARDRAEEIAKREGFDDDLYEFCARGSAILWNELTKAGIETKIVYNPGHIFCYAGGYYVDITATQFGNKFGKTMVRMEKSVENLNTQSYMRHGEHLFPDWSINCAWKVFNNVQSLQAWQQVNNWQTLRGIVNMSDLIPVSKYHYINNNISAFVEIDQ